MKTLLYRASRSELLWPVVVGVVVGVFFYNLVVLAFWLADKLA